MKPYKMLLLVAAVTALPSLALAEEASDTAKPIPVTRPEMKQALEALKGRRPRLPLPPLTDEEKQRYGDRPVVNNGRARRLYLPEAWYAADFRQDPAMTLDYAFKVELFWIVSRGNNCQYCLGHQEVKLTSAGRTEDEIAALDGDWSKFAPARRAAMEFTRKLTLQPHEVTEADIAALRKHYTNEQVVEIVHTVAMYNSVNRWTDSLGLPQDQRFRDHEIAFLTPTSPQFVNVRTHVAPLSETPRPALETREEVERRLDECRRRSPRVTLASEVEAGKILPADSPEASPPQWVCALAHFSDTGAMQIRALRAIEREGRLTPQLKAQLAWICARENRAWYALECARERLQKLGFDDDAVYSLDEPQGRFSDAERTAFAFARKLTSSPHLIADADIARLRKHYSDHETAEIVYVVCASNYFDRFTESLGLTLER